MALVVKSWKVSSRSAAGEANVAIVARDSGLLSFILSIVGVDPTTTLQVSSRHVFFEKGDLSGFERRFIPLEHIASTYYGRVKPWKTAGLFIAFSILIGGSLMGHSTGLTVLGTLVFLGGIVLSLLYYYLNRELTIGVVDVSGWPGKLSFKRSVIEGQEINEGAVENVVQIIEHLIKPTEGAMPPNVLLGSDTRPGAMSAAAPKNLTELGRNLGMTREANESSAAAFPNPATATPRQSSGCPKCGASVQGDEAFCGSCGFKLR